jgi:hypothetical protein
MPKDTSFNFHTTAYLREDDYQRPTETTIVKAGPSAAIREDLVRYGRDENNRVGHTITAEERTMIFITKQLAEMNSNVIALREEVASVKAERVADRAAAVEKEAELELKLHVVQKRAAEKAKHEVANLLAHNEQISAINRATAELHSTQQLYNEAKLDLQVAHEKYECEEPPKRDKDGPTCGQKLAQIDVNRANAQVGIKLEGLRKARAEVQRLYEAANADPSAVLHAYNE